MSNARLYIRRSSEDQSALSPQAQERETKRWCEQEGHTVAGIYIDDDLSGTREDRPNFQKMIRDARSDPHSIIVVHKFDRLARDTEVILRTIYKELLPRRVKVESVMERIDIYTPLGKLMLTYSGGVSTYFSDNLSTEISKGLREKAERGGWIGPLAFGYRAQFQYDAKGERIRGSGRAVPSEDAATVRQIFEWYATGNHSFTTIAEQLNARGYTMLNRHGRGAFSTDTVGGILVNPFYIGTVTYNDGTYPGAHEPLIDQATWEACQRLRNRRKTQGGGSTPGKRATGLLSEVGACACCGAPLHWLQTGRSTSQQRYYYCKARRKYGASRCNTTMQRSDALNARVIEVLGQLAIPEHIQEAVLSGALARLAQPAPSRAADTRLAEEQLRRLRVAYRAGDPDLTDDAYLREAARLEARLADEPAPTQRMVDLEKALQLLGSIPALLAVADESQRRALVQTVFQTIWTAHGAVVAIQPTPAYGLLLDVTVVTPTGEKAALVTLPPRWKAFKVAA